MIVRQVVLKPRQVKPSDVPPFIHNTFCFGSSRIRFRFSQRRVQKTSITVRLYFILKGHQRAELEQSNALEFQQPYGNHRVVSRI